MGVGMYSSMYGKGHGLLQSCEMDTLDSLDGPTRTETEATLLVVPSNSPPVDLASTDAHRMEAASTAEKHPNAAEPSDESASKRARLDTSEPASTHAVVWIPRTHHQCLHTHTRHHHIPCV